MEENRNVMKRIILTDITLACCFDSDFPPPPSGKQSEIMLRLSFQWPSSVFRDRVQTSSARALHIIMPIHRKRDIIMCILQNALLLRVHIIIPVLLIQNSIIMHYWEYRLMHLRQFKVIAQTESASWSIAPSQYALFFINTHYNVFFTNTLKTDSEHWTRSLKTESEKNSPLSGKAIDCMVFAAFFTINKSARYVKNKM